MNEQLLFEKFKELLLQKKNFKENNLLHNPSLINIGHGIKLNIDLVLIDDDKNNLALIEFKSVLRVNQKNQIKTQLKHYADSLNDKTLQLYLVHSNENDLIIEKISANNDWEFVSSDSFPTLEYLSSQKKILENIENKENDDQKLIIKKRKLRITLQTLFLFLVTVMILYSVLEISQNLKKNIFYENKTTNFDSLIFDMQIELDKLKLMTKLDSITVYNPNKYTNDLDKRISTLEDGLINSPEKALRLNKINHEIEQLRTKIENENNISNIKIEGLREHINLIYSILTGLILAIIAFAISFIKLKEN